MTPDERAALKAACVQAAATLVAAWWPVVRSKDIQAGQAMQELQGNAMHCARIADLLYAQVAGIDWKVPATAVPRVGPVL